GGYTTLPQSGHRRVLMTRTSWLLPTRTLPRSRADSILAARESEVPMSPRGHEVRFRFVLVLLGAISCVGHPPIARPAPPSAEDQIRARSQAYAGMVLKMDDEGIAALFTEDGELLGGGPAPVKGRGAILAFLKTFSQYHVEANQDTTTSVEVK